MLSVILSNITSPNKLLLNSCFRNLTFKLHVLYILNMHANFQANWMLFTNSSINSFFMHYFELQKFEFKKLIDDLCTNL